MAPKGFIIFLSLLSFSALSLLSPSAQDVQNTGLVMNFYKETCPQTQEIIKEQVKLLYKRYKNTAFSSSMIVLFKYTYAFFLSFCFFVCKVLPFFLIASKVCFSPNWVEFDASLLLDSTRNLSEKER